MPAHHASGIIFDGVGLHHAPSLYSSVSAPAYICPSDKAPTCKQKHPLLKDTMETAVFKSAPLLSAASKLTARFFSGLLRWKRRVSSPLRSALQTSRLPHGFSSDPLRPFIACHAALQTTASVLPRNQRPPLLKDTQEMLCIMSALIWIPWTQPTSCTARLFFILKDTPETAGVQPAPFLSADSTPAALVSSGSLRHQSAPQKQHCRADWSLRLKSQWKR